MTKRLSGLRLLPCLAAGGLLACAPPNTDPDAGPKNDAGSEDCERESWDIQEDTTFTAACSPYELEASVNVSNNATLTLEPGVELRFAQGNELHVDNGRLVAEGTADEPIVITALDEGAGAGAWDGIEYTGSALSGNVLRHVVVRYGGDEDSGNSGCVTLDSTSGGRVTIEDSRFESCAQSGVAARYEGSTFASFTGNSFVNSPVGLWLHPSIVGSVGAGQTYEETPQNLLEDGDVTETTTWALQSVPWHALGSIDVGSDDEAVLTLAPGTVLRFEQGQSLDVGFSRPGGLVAVGTEEAPIVFESADANAEPGAWGGVVFSSYTLNGSRVEQAIFREGGGDGVGVRGCLDVDQAEGGRVAVVNNRFERCLHSAVSVETDGSRFAAFSGNTFEDCEAGMWLPPNVIGSVEDAQTYTNTPHNLIEGFDPVDTTQTWVAQSVPWVSYSAIDIGGDESPVLTIEAGTTLRFPEDASFTVGYAPGGLVLAGTEGAPVTLESSEPTPNAGSWSGLRFTDATLSGSLIEHAIIRHAGDLDTEDYGAIVLDRVASDVTIRNTTFEDNAPNDIFVDCESSPVLEGNTTPAGVEYNDAC